MVKFGRISEYNTHTHVATIHFIRPDACAKCGACGSLNQVGCIQLECIAQEGNWVRISFPDRHFLGSAALAYVFPLVFFFIGLFSGYYLSGRIELWGLVGALFGLLISLVGLRLTEMLLHSRRDWIPVVDRVYIEKPTDIEDLGCDR